ncbi:MAG TPA: hypothetical protein VGF96_14200 [Terracidiphilus sp.]
MGVQFIENLEPLAQTLRFEQPRVGPPLRKELIQISSDHHY